MDAEMIRYLGITVEFPMWATGHAGTTKCCNSALLCVLLFACSLLVPFATSATGIPDADTLLQFNERLRTNDVAGVRAMLDEGIDPEIIDNDVQSGINGVRDD